jgi:hypothetical protein
LSGGLDEWGREVLFQQYASGPKDVVFKDEIQSIFREYSPSKISEVPKGEINAILLDRDAMILDEVGKNDGAEHIEGVVKYWVVSEQDGDFLDRFIDAAMFLKDHAEIWLLVSGLQRESINVYYVKDFEDIPNSIDFLDSVFKDTKGNDEIGVREAEEKEEGYDDRQCEEYEEYIGSDSDKAIEGNRLKRSTLERSTEMAEMDEIVEINGDNNDIRENRDMVSEKYEEHIESDIDKAIEGTGLEGSTLERSTEMAEMDKVIEINGDNNDIKEDRDKIEKNQQGKEAKEKTEDSVIEEKRIGGFVDSSGNESEKKSMSHGVGIMKRSVILNIENYRRELYVLLSNASARGFLRTRYLLSSDEDKRNRVVCQVIERFAREDSIIEDFRDILMLTAEVHLLTVEIAIENRKGNMKSCDELKEKLKKLIYKKTGSFIQTMDRMLYFYSWAANQTFVLPEMQSYLELFIKLVNNALLDREIDNGRRHLELGRSSWKRPD